LFVSTTMGLVMYLHRRNQSRSDSLHLIGVEKSGRGH